MLELMLSPLFNSLRSKGTNSVENEVAIAEPSIRFQYYRRSESDGGADSLPFL